MLGLPEIEDVLTHFELRGEVKYYPLTGSGIKESYYVKVDQEEFILSLHFEGEEEKLRRMALLSDHLLEYGIPTSSFVCTNEGYATYTLNERPVTLKKFIPGYVTRDLSDEILESIGVVLGNLHQVPVPFDYKFDPPYDLKDYRKVCKANPFLGRWISDKMRYLKDKLSPDLPVGLVHSDLFWDHIVCDGNKVKALIDFDHSTYFYLGFDLAMCVIGTCMSGDDVNLNKLKALLKGYKSVYKMKPEEQLVFPYYLAYAATTSAFWRFRQYHIYDTNPSKRGTYKSVMRVADKYEEPEITGILRKLKEEQILEL